MNEALLRKELEASESISSEKAISSRLSKAKAAEAILGEDLDAIIRDDNKMYKALVTLKKHKAEHNGCYQNALRWYYKAKTGKTFPTLIQYENTYR